MAAVEDAVAVEGAASIVATVDALHPPEADDGNGLVGAVRSIREGSEEGSATGRAAMSTTGEALATRTSA